jgi:hypothetical protein
MGCPSEVAAEVISRALWKTRFLSFIFTVGWYVTTGIYRVSVWSFVTPPYDLETVHSSEIEPGGPDQRADCCQGMLYSFLSTSNHGTSHYRHLDDTLNKRVSVIIATMTTGHIAV